MHLPTYDGNPVHVENQHHFNTVEAIVSFPWPTLCGVRIGRVDDVTDVAAPLLADPPGQTGWGETLVVDVKDAAFVTATRHHGLRQVGVSETVLGTTPHLWEGNDWGGSSNVES